MKIIRILGGLGNQMFQYAFYKAMEKRFPNVKADLTGFKGYDLHNGFELERIFDIRLNKTNPLIKDLYNSDNRNWFLRKLRRLLKLKKAYKSEQDLFSFDREVFQDSEIIYYWGYWQNQDYFLDMTEMLKEDFSFNQSLVGQNRETSKDIETSNSVSIHVRRGDYLIDPLLGEICQKEYYLQAIALIKEKVSTPKFFVFSDDIQWCQENLNIEDGVFVNWNKGTDSYIDMQLMSYCKHNIIANSSFSWWGAWLNQYPEKMIIGPKKWVNDVRFRYASPLPKEWMRL